MRGVVRVLRHGRHCCRMRKELFLGGIRCQKVSALRESGVCSSGRSLFGEEFNRQFSNRIMRVFSTYAASDSAGDGVGSSGPLVEYERRIAARELVDGDAFQVDTIVLLQKLYEQLIENEDECQLDRYKASHKAGRKCNWRKRRRHFHDFMLDIHRRLQMHKGVADPLEVVAGEISDESILLCLDEFMVTDVADALILYRLFKHLFSKGIVLVSTSNRASDNLYEGGLQRDLFLPFIDTLKERCVIHEIGSSTDYRKLTSVIFLSLESAEQGFYYIGHNSAVLLQKFYELIGREIPSPQIVEVAMGRQLQIPLGVKGCAYFPFIDLCDKPLGAADYLGLFEKFHTLALDGVPKFGIHNRSAAYRFVTLIDVMYENKARLLCIAVASPTELFEKIVTVVEAQRISPRSSSRSRKIDDLDLCVDNELGFSKDRTISRLTEMNSREYLEQHDASFQERAKQEFDENGGALQA
ncbi:hypothetical protein AXF42_Ash004544 [Apostasia shenzhenica]|uniref:Lactation elevated protein 1 n=1 Tax=Apostasia shenzhenica TaxID=1088818 RepID=A0A2I0BGX4_9ASPA|nr:hypothetical protein AXF42_Ash004544 [Apostasia shenzhenica]